jgi:hypothetical protein
MIIAPFDGCVVNRFLQDPRVDLAAQNNVAISSASQCGRLDVVNCLPEDPRVDPAAQNNVATSSASQ